MLCIMVVWGSGFADVVIPIMRSEGTISSIEIACGADKPLGSHSKTVMKQEVNAVIYFGE